MNDDGAYGLEEEPPLPPPVEPADPSASAGQLIREAREAAGVSLEDMGTTLKVPVRKLEALENDRHDQLPDAMFIRALASSVCRALNVDARPILARLPELHRAPFEGTGSSLNTPFKSTSSRSIRPANAVSVLAFLFSPAVLVVLALLAGAAVLLLSPKLPWIDKFMANRGAANVSQAASGPLLPPGGVADDVGDTGSRPNNPGSLVTTGPLTPAPAEAPAAPAPAVTAAVPPPAAEPPRLAPTLTAASAIASGEASDLVRFEVRAASWIEVADAAGKQPLRRLLSAGESIAVGGKPPLRVIVGRADSVNVSVRGQPLNIEALARDNVARFEVK